ncbi:uncharacterized protein SOCE26_052750 [Sorangium cellulosum]|uniref:Uncharacterized protein n=1 Tax=Sorangium cellulosum TaxID=56 RepID=A0A2L0EWY8_SORCE|nr:uncharacterized protein SOCE26_052750 [Sorangium cellulosum]
MRCKRCGCEEHLIGDGYVQCVRCAHVEPAPTVRPPPHSAVLAALRDPDVHRLARSLGRAAGAVRDDDSREMFAALSEAAATTARIFRRLGGGE